MIVSVEEETVFIIKYTTLFLLTAQGLERVGVPGITPRTNVRGVKEDLGWEVPSSGRDGR